MLIFVDPTLGDLLKWDRVEVMQFLAAPPNGHNKVRFLQKGEMFCNGLACHLEVLAEFTQSLAIVIVQLVEQLSSAWIGEGLKDFIHSTLLMQLNSCMSSKRLLIRVSGRSISQQQFAVFDIPRLENAVLDAEC